MRRGRPKVQVDYEQITIRLPKEITTYLRDLAEKEERSLNKKAEHAMKDWYARELASKAREHNHVVAP